MVKDLVIKAREDSLGGPLQVICDNMVTFYDNCGRDVVIWDDAKEVAIVFRPNGQFEQDAYPFEIMYTPYEYIEFMKSYRSPKDSAMWLEKNKSKLSAERYEVAKGILKESIGRRGYTGTIVNKDLSK